MPLLTLSQTTGPRPRIVTLEKSSLPERELEERYELSYKKTYYPGAPEPSVQILNAESRPIKMEGLLSDREARNNGYADMLREQLRALYQEARPVRLQYRTINTIGLITRCDFFERDRFETRYEIEFDPTSQPPVAQNFYQRPLRLSDVFELEGLASDLASLWAELPETIRQGPLDAEALNLAALFAEVPAYKEMPILDVEALPLPVQVLFQRDPWLEARIQYDELQASLRTLLELSGNERLLNLDDRAQVVTRGAMIAANRVRYALADFTAPGLGIVDRIEQISHIGDFVSIIDSIRLAL